VEGTDKDGAPLVRKPERREKFCGLVFKLQADPYVGNLAFIRVYSGELKVGDKVFNPLKRKKEKISKLLKLHANKREEVDLIGPGDIGAVVGLKFTTTGDTLCGSGDYIVLETMDFPEPVIGVAIEARTRADEGKLAESLDKIAREDPSFRISVDSDTGQQIISGMLTVCMKCHKVRIDDEVWQKIESYLADRNPVEFSHGYCPDCFEEEMKIVNSTVKGERAK